MSLIAILSIDTKQYWHKPIQKEDLCRVMDLLPLGEQHARSLLIHCRWDVERVIAVLVEKGKEQLYIDAGVAVVKHDDLSLSKFSSQLTCNVCMEDLSTNDMTIMDCGHYFCNNCRHPSRFLFILFHDHCLLPKEFLLVINNIRNLSLEKEIETASPFIP